METTFTLKLNEEFRVACLLFNIPTVKLLQQLIDDIRLPIAKNEEVANGHILATDYFLYYAGLQYGTVYTNLQKAFLKHKEHERRSLAMQLLNLPANEQQLEMQRFFKTWLLEWEKRFG